MEIAFNNERGLMSDQKPSTPKLLSLSGGGFRGFFQANILSYMEAELGMPLARLFALIAGTSIGGINALSLAAEIPTEKMVNFYKDWGPKIFPKIRWPLGLIRQKFSDKQLRAALEQLLEDRTIEDLKHKVLIPAVNLSTGMPQVFKTPHHDSLKMDKEYRLVDVALATSAAPTYFPIHKMDGLYGWYMVDGGLVANHPGLYACIEAERFLNMDSQSYKLLHIGTMSSGITDVCKTVNSGFLTRWRGKLFDLSISAQEAATENILKFKLGPDRYMKIDVTPPKEQVKFIALDKANPKAQQILSQQARSAYQNARTALQKYMAEGE